MDKTTLNDEEWHKIQWLMDKPPKASEALKELMNKKHDVEVDIDVRKTKQEA